MKSDAAMKILLGGIPLGCDNIGDEAIIACVVGMLKESIPGVSLTVATADPATAELLGVDTVPPFGFAGHPVDGFAAAAKRHDAYVWCGATGLSDYPNIALDLLEAAQNAGVPTFVWGVGMDDELNPVFFRLHGRRRILMKTCGLAGWWERRLRRRLSERISRILPRCAGVWLRDPQSAAMLASMGFAGAAVTADTAILLPRPDAGAAQGHSRATLGLCISAQRQVADLDGVSGMISAVRASGAAVLGIPMNPKTDRSLLERLGVECIPGTTPAAAAAAAASCDLILSSRLHLLIIAANVGTPILGIARGSKLANWLSNFGQTVEGGVYDCDWRKLSGKVVALLGDGGLRGSFSALRDRAYSRLMSRLDGARRDFVASLLKLKS